jgi:hypothetical protein
VARTGGGRIVAEDRRDRQWRGIEAEGSLRNGGERRRLESLVVVGWLGIVLCGTFSELYLVLGPLSIESMIA